MNKVQGFIRVCLAGLFVFLCALAPRGILGIYFQLNLILWASAKLLPPSMHLAAALGHKLAFSKWACTLFSCDVAMPNLHTETNVKKKNNIAAQL